MLEVSSLTVREQQREPLMIRTYKNARISGVMALLVALLSTGVENARAGKVKNYLVRATQYHKTDPHCDPWTRRGQTSTQLRLPQSDKVVTNPNIIGNVAIDPQKVPEGSLVFETQTQRFFVATTGGQAVISRKAAKKTAQKKELPEQYKNALVFDFYYPREIVDNEFTYCWVIPHESDIRFRNLKLADQKQRLYASFWLERLSKIYENTSDEVQKQKLRQMIKHLKVNDRRMTLG